MTTYNEKISIPPTTVEACGLWFLWESVIFFQTAR